MHRRFLLASLVLGLMAAAPLPAQAPLPRPPRVDVLIRHGRVLDGTGNPWRRADIAIVGDRIAFMGTLTGVEAAVVIDAADRYVAPGFIDSHSHAGPGLAEPALRAARPLLAQGITTAFVNPDGSGPVDLAAQRTALEQRHTGVNVGLFVPHGSVRRAVMQMADRAPDASELARMAALVRDGMRAGALGLSSGLYYAPGSYATTAEVVALAREAAAAGGVYQSHIRDEADYSVGVVAAVDEVITIAEQARLPGIVTHMKALGRASWGASSMLIAHVEAARRRGVEVLADQYPYEASGTSLVGALMPRWAQAGGTDAMRRRMTGELRPKVRTEVAANIDRRGGADTLLVSRYAPDPSIEGRRIGALAAAAGRTPDDYVLDLLAKDDASLVSFNMQDEDIDRIMRQPWTMTCTDGGLQPMDEGMPHPRGYGAFARKLELYVRERGVVDLAFAIRSMTSLPAAVYGIKDRGVLRPGAFADLVVFDLDRVDDVATYDRPHQLAAGMDTILVNGQLMRRDGAWTDALPGRVLRPDRQ